MNNLLLASKLQLQTWIRARLGFEVRVLAKNSSWVTLANTLVVLNSFAQTAILARIFGLKDLGLFVLVLASIDTIGEILNPNVDVAAVKYLGEFREASDYPRIVAFLKFAFLLAGICALVSVAVTAVVAMFIGKSLFGEMELVPYAIILSAGRNLSFVDSIWMSYLRVFNKFKLNSIVRIILTLGESAAICIVAYVTNGSLKSVFIVMTITSISGFVIRGIAAMVETLSVIWPHRKATVGLLQARKKDIARFVINNSLSRTIKTIHTKGDVLILGSIAGATEVALYAVAKKLALTIAVLVDPFRTAIYPQLVWLISQKNIDKTRAFLRELSGKLLIPMGLGLLCLLFFGKNLLELFFGKGYESALRAQQILVIGVTFNSLFFWTVPLLMSLEKTGLRLKVDVINVVVGVGVAIALVPKFGALGSAIALSVTYIFGQALLVVLTREFWAAKKVL